MANTSVEIFPASKLVHGIKKTVQFPPTSILTNGTYEYRVQRGRWEKFRYSIPSRAILNTDRDAVYQFYSSHRGLYTSFLFEDPERSFNNTTLTYDVAADGWLFSYPGTVSHPLFHQDAGLVFKRNNVITTPTIDTTNTFPVIKFAGQAPSDVITVTGKIYLIMRFDSDVSWSFEALDLTNKPVVSGFDEILLQEVFDI